MPENFHAFARRRHLVGVGLLLLLLALAVGAPGCGCTPAPPPDIVLFVWDTCRADRTSVAGYGLPTTPRLSGLAEEGVRFPWCFAPSPWTPPSHASLFTGLLPSRHGLREGVGDRVRFGLRPLAASLALAGYETVAAPANPLLGATGLLEGFETVLPPTAGAEKDPGEVVAARVEGWFRGRQRKDRPRRPLFLFVNLMDCHLPLAPSRADLVAVHGAEGAALPMEGPRNGRGVTPADALAHSLGVRLLEEDRIRWLSDAYDAGVRAADRATGRILDLLESEGIRRGALVAVAGDHGESLGEHGELEHRMSLADTVLRVPLVVRWPGGRGGGVTEDAQVRLQDLYRTILDAAGVPAPQGTGLDSVSLAGPAVQPRDAVAELQAPAAAMEFLRARFPDLPRSVVRRLSGTRIVLREAARGPSRRKYLLVLPDGPEGEGPEREELHDLAADPGETRNLLGPEGNPSLRVRAIEAVR